MQHSVRHVVHQGFARPCVQAAVSIRDAVELMNRLGLDHVLVLDEDRPVGWLEARRVLEALERGVDLTRETARSLAVPAAAAPIAPETSLDEAVELMRASGEHHLAVIESGELVGTVEEGDLLRSEVSELRAQLMDLTSYIHGPFTTPSRAPSTGGSRSAA